MSHITSAVAYFGLAPTTGALAEDFADLAEAHACQIIATYRDDVPPSAGLAARPGLCRAIGSLRPSYHLLAESLDALAVPGSPEADAIAIELAHRKAKLGVIRNGDHAWELHGSQVAAALRVLRATIRAARHMEDNGPSRDQTPYGYGRDRERHVLVRDPEEQAAVRSMILWKRDGKRLPEMVRMLEEQGFPPRGRAWHANTVRRILIRAGAWVLRSDDTCSPGIGMP